MKTKFSALFLFFILNAAAFAQDFKIVSSDQNSISVEYLPAKIDTVLIQSNGTSYFNFIIPLARAVNLTEKGMPQKFVREFHFGVPAETGNTLQILSQEYSYLSGKLIPVHTLQKDSISNSFVYNEAAEYSQSRFSDDAAFGDFGLIRNLGVQSIQIYPVQFDGSKNQIRILKKLTFKLNYARPANISYEKIKDDFYKALILNWPDAQNWGIKQTFLGKASASNFAVGDWFKLETPTEGIYKIDRNFLQSIGINVSNVDPRTIKIFGYGGYSLPEQINSSFSNKTLTENAIWVEGENDGSFDAADYILFYGRPVEFWEYNSGKGNIQRIKQPYTKKNFYWLTFGNGNGKRMENKVSVNSQNPYMQTNTIAHKHYDKDSVNIGKSGYIYLSDPLNNNIKSRTFINKLSGILPASQVTYNYNLVNSSNSALTFRIEESGTIITSGSISGRGKYDYGIDRDGTVKINNNLVDERSVLKFVLNSGGIDSEMYLDFFEITYLRNLNAAGDSLFVFSKDTTAVISYTFGNFSNSSIKVFDVTDFANAKVISNASISGGQITFQAEEKQKSVSKYFALNEGKFRSPVNHGKISNINLRGNLSGSEMIVITAKEFKTQAEEYAAYRSTESPNKLSTSIFYVDDIMLDFAGGLLDPTAIRDFLKFAYENWQTKPKYVLLFGDGSYDYLNTVKNNNNFVPTYQYINPFFPFYEILSYPMDDYFSRVSGNDKNADLAVGRLNVNSADEAKKAVQKIIAYETGEAKGDWRHRITLIADDGPAGGTDDGSIHTYQSETLAKQKIPEYIDEDKIYLVAYPTEFVGLGRRKPGVNKAIINAINEGTLVLNYVGHGAPKFWAHEYVFETAVAIPQMTNKNYFMLTAATCDFGRYDDPDEQSGAEELLALENTGAILAMTAARVVESTANDALNQLFYSNIFNVHNLGGTSDRIGLAYMLTKQVRVDNNDEKFHLYGDPAIRLNLPKLEVNVDSLNGRSTNVTAQISALGNVRIKGSIRNENGTKNSTNGEVVVSVYDSQREQYFNEMNYKIELQGGLIYRGRASVSDGEFLTEFVVPKDISYENKNGKIVVYFYNDNTDGVGTTNNFKVGGTDTTVVNDGVGPEIELFFDDENFSDSYLVNSNFTLIAKLNDMVGINTTGTGIGHKLEGILNDDLANTIDFTNYFVGDLNAGGKSGVIKYPFTSMEEGDHKIKVKAWDVFNNYSFKETNFTVVSSEEGIVLRDVYNYPNPFSSNTTFTFQHNFSGAVNVRIKIYTIAGRLIKEIEENDLMKKFVRVDWDGRDEDSNSIASGTYLYKLIVQSADGSFRQSVLGKLAVVR